MLPSEWRASSTGRKQLAVALLCLAVGQAFVFLRWRPITDFYFFLVWIGYILLADWLVYRRSGRSLLRRSPGRFLAMFPVSSAFWWVFEQYNGLIQNWVYLGSDSYHGLGYVLVASLFFSTVLPAVWETAELLLTFMPRPAAPAPACPGSPSSCHSRPPSPPPQMAATRPPARAESPAYAWLPGLGIMLSALPLLAPREAFPLVWIGLFVLLDPLNGRAGRPSILLLLRSGHWQAPVAFYAGTTITGFFWEFWNYWAWPKWIYTLHPLVEEFPRLFEMPLPGYLGYGPFGWELFAMWWFTVGLWERLRGLVSAWRWRPGTPTG